MQKNMQKNKNGGDRVHRKMKKGISLLALTFIFAVALAGAVSAEDTSTDSGTLGDTPLVTANDVTSDAPTTEEPTTTSTDQQLADAQTGDQGNPTDQATTKPDVTIPNKPDDPADIAVTVAFYDQNLDPLNALQNGFPTPITATENGATVWKVVRCYHVVNPLAIDPAFVHVLDYLDPTYFTINSYQMWTITKTSSGSAWVQSKTGTYDTVNGDWNVGEVAAPPANYWDNYLFINVTVHGSNEMITNQAAVISSRNSTGPVFDPQLSNNIAGAALQLQPAANIAVVKWFQDVPGFNYAYLGITTANYMDNVWAFFQVVNYGPDIAKEVIVTDPFPAGLTFDTNNLEFSLDNNVWTSVAPGVVTWVGKTLTLNIGDLPIYTTPYWIDFRLPVTVTGTGHITNTATQTQSVQTPNPDGSTTHTASAYLDVPPAADIAVDKVWEDATGHSITNANYLDTVVAHLTVTNNGPDAANGVVLTDTLPADFVFDAASSWISYGQTGESKPLNDCIHWTYLAGVFTWSITDHLGTALLPGAANACEVWLHGTNVAHGNTVVSNTADVSSTTFDYDLLNNEATDSYTANANAHVVLDKFYADYDQFVNHNYNIVQITNPVNYLDKVIVILTAHNNGPDTVTYLAVDDNWPIELLGTNQYWDHPDAATWNFFPVSPPSGIWTWSPPNLVPLHPGDTFLTAIGATVNASNTVITNTITTVDQIPTDPIGYDTASADLTVNPAADLAVTKDVNDVTPDLGQLIMFTIDAKNFGPDASYATLFDLLPAGLVFDAVNTHATQGTYDPVTGIWDVGWLNPNGFATLYLYATVSPGANPPEFITNIATISGLWWNGQIFVPEYDPVMSNNVDTEVVFMPEARVVIDKVVNVTSQNVGGNVVYTLTATNWGPENATHVVVNDVLPAGLTFVSAVGDGSYNSILGVWTINQINAFPAMVHSAVIHITATVTSAVAGTTVTNTATLYQLDQYDPQVGMSDSASFYVPKADIAVAKDFWKGTFFNVVTSANYMDTVMAAINVTNLGPDTAHGVMVTDIWPTELTATGDWWVSWNNGVSWILNDSSFNPATGIWNVATVTTTNSFWLAIEAIVNDSDTTIGNTATKTSETEFDPNTANDHDTALLTVPPASDIYVLITSNNNNPTVGEIITITFKVGNNGPDPASNVVLTMSVPAGMEFVGFVGADQGTYSYNAATNTITWNLGTVGVVDPYLQAQFRPTTSGAFVFQPQVTTDTYDRNLQNNIATLTVNAVQPKAEVSAARHKVGIPMQTTGAPVVPMLFAVLLVLAGFATTRRK